MALGDLCSPRHFLCKGAGMGRYIEKRCVTALHKPPKGKGSPFAYDLNPYRGCEHRCQYCFAQYSHAYLEDGDYFGDIYVKTNIAERLDRELSGGGWDGTPLNLGGVTDCYQPCEARYRLMPQVWQVLLKHKAPCIISTKSSLILRDFELIERLASLVYVNVACTITTLDGAVARKLEVGAADPADRLEVLRAFAKTKASTGLHMMPIVPYITDGEETIRALHQAGKEAGVDYVLPGMLNLRGKTKETFLACVVREFPAQYRPIWEAYRTGHLDKEIGARAHARVRAAQRAFGIGAAYMAPYFRRQEERAEQLSLF